MTLHSRTIFPLIAMLAGAPAGAQGSRIPLCPGLQIVTAVSQPNGDYESIKTVLSVDEKSVRIRYSTEQLVTDLMDPEFGKVRKINVSRAVSRQDLLSATSYQQRWFPRMPESIPGTTALGTSAQVLAALKQTGRSDFAISNAYSGDVTADRNVSPNLYDYQSAASLERVSPRPVGVPVLVNGVRTELQAIHARADFAGDKSEFFFLDDAANPLALKFRIGIGAVQPMNEGEIALCETMLRSAPEMADALKAMCGRRGGGDSETLHVVKITYRCAAPAPRSAPAGAGSGAPAAGAGGLSAGAAQLEQALAKEGRFEVYDIFFSFNSDRIREESLPRIAEIAAVLTKHPDWTLAVNGHTDGIGSEASNLQLSQRRAAAVKDALVRRHKIAPARLETAGFGEAQPRDTNDTLEGRARNRRVELVKR